jgi:hypothetical protein
MYWFASCATVLCARSRTRSGATFDEIETGFENLLALQQKLVVAREIARIERPDLRAEIFLVAVVVKYRTVFEPDVVERIDRPDVHVLRRLLAVQREQIVDQPRRGDDRRARIEGEAVLLPDVRAAAGLVTRFDDRDVVPLRAQPDGRRESTESTADDDDVHTGVERLRDRKSSQLKPSRKSDSRGMSSTGLRRSNELQCERWDSNPHAL